MYRSHFMRCPCRKGQVRNIGGSDIRAQAQFIAALFQVAI
jgi:hypothetical protein